MFSFQASGFVGKDGSGPFSLDILVFCIPSQQILQKGRKINGGTVRFLANELGQPGQLGQHIAVLIPGGIQQHLGPVQGAVRQLKEGNFDIKFHQEEIGHIIYQNETQIIECIANMSLIETDIEVLTKDGNYINLIDGSSVEVRNAHLRIKKDPIVIISKK